MIVGFCGVAGSGKDTAANFLVENDGFIKVAFADPLKRICQDVFKFSDEQLWGPSEKRNADDKRYKRGRFLDQDETRDVFLTPRFALQQLGSEWGRNCYPDVWVDYAVRVANQLLESTIEDDAWKEGPKGYHSLYYSAKNGLWVGNNVRQVRGVTISDVRFMNEIKAIQKAGGTVVRLLRGEGLAGEAGKHISEKELQEIPLETFNHVINNSEWTLKELEEYLKYFVVNERKGKK